MKISQGIESLLPANSQATGAKGAHSGPAATKVTVDATGTATSAPDLGSLSISTLSSRLQTLESRLADGESFDAARVSQIKQSIRDESYTIDTEAIANKLISNARDLYTRRH